MSRAGLRFEEKIAVSEEEILTPEEQGTSGGGDLSAQRQPGSSEPCVCGTPGQRWCPSIGDRQSLC